jgi:DNA-binding LacI/PurR family transcriptional regulator
MAPGTTKKVNINTIAKMAHVSTTTVSNYINAREVFPISAETKTRISTVMRELNYRPHIGGSLIGRKAQLTEKVCFVFGPDTELPAFDVVQLPLLSRLLRDLSVAVSEQLGMKLEVRAVKDGKNIRDWNELLLDASYVINYEPLNSMLHDLLQRKNIPLLELSTAGVVQRFDPNRALLEGENPVAVTDESVCADHIHWNIRKQTLLMMDYLYEHGCRNMLMMPSWNIKANRNGFYGLDAEEKIAGFQEALEKYPDLNGDILYPPMPQNHDMYYEATHAYETLMGVAEKLPGVDAIVSHNDIVAQGVVSALHASGLAPGKDVMVAGAGDFKEYKYMMPPIVTSSYDRDRCVAEVCRLIERRKNEPQADYDSVEIPGMIIES